ncbi:MAG: hypothetical protein ACP5HU_11510 [Phycisphaerae bacterium]
MRDPMVGEPQNTKADNTRPQDAHDGSDHISGANGLSDALRNLRKAAASRRPESICPAFKKLRQAGKGMKLEQLFAKADEAVGEPARPLVVSAFAHWHCFMCDDGAVECELCEGTGKDEDGEVCTACGGLGFSPCEFCNGTGWVDRDLIPEELKHAVLKHQVASVRKELDRLKKILPNVTEEQIRSLGHKEKSNLARRLLRLQARMRNLADSGAVEDKHAELYRRAAAGLDKTINLLRGE